MTGRAADDEPPRPRIEHPAALLPDAAPALHALIAAARHGGLEPVLSTLLHLRVSQVNGCGPCVDGSADGLRAAGESEARIAAVAAWRETPWFTGAERAALALAEAITRLSDRADPVPDEVWNRAAQHFDERGLAALVLSVSTSNLLNRLNRTTRQIAGPWDRD